MDDSTPSPPDGPLPAGRAVGLHLRTYREEHGLSQRALARELGWSQPTLSRAESDASAMWLGRVDAALRHTGARLELPPIDARRD